MYERALAGKEKALGPEHTSTLDTVNNLGIIYTDQGRLAEAEEMYKRALAGYEKALGPEHTSTLRTVNNLGIFYRDQGRLAEAEEMFKRALAGKEKVLGPKHTSTLDVSQRLHASQVLQCTTLLSFLLKAIRLISTANEEKRQPRKRNALFKSLAFARHRRV
jgi:tetratricopeptide (TPR) repeat protein